MSRLEAENEEKTAQGNTLVIFSWTPSYLKGVLLKSDKCKKIVAFGTEQITPQRP